MTDKITNWTSADDAMVENAIRRGASRRELLKMLLAGGVAIAGGQPVLGRATNAVAAEPVSGGNFKAAGWSSSTADTLDPAKASLSTDYVRCCSLYNRLTFLDKDGVHADGARRELRHARTPRPGPSSCARASTFHDGKTLTADDVVYSLKRHLDPAVGSKVATDRHADDRLQGGRQARPSKSRWPSPNADLPTILAHAPFHDRRRTAPRTSPRPTAPAPSCSKRSSRACARSGIKNKNYWKSSKALSRLLRVLRHHRRHRPRQRAAVGRHPFRRLDQSALDHASSRASRGFELSKTTVGQLHGSQHAPRHGAGQQGRTSSRA